MGLFSLSSLYFELLKFYSDPFIASFFSLIVFLSTNKYFYHYSDSLKFSLHKWAEYLIYKNRERKHPGLCI